MKNKHIISGDVGNTNTKIYRGGNDGALFPSNLRVLTNAEWLSVKDVNSSAIRPGYAEITRGQATYRVSYGEMARRYMLADKPRGADRYREDYYGLLMAVGIAEVYERNTYTIDLVATFPPGDRAYVANLISAVKGEWRVKILNREVSFNIANVHAMPEPIGGLNNYNIVKNQNGYALRTRGTLFESEVLFIDIGGGTTDLGAFSSGNIDVTTLTSRSIGAIDITETFIRQLRNEYTEELRQMRNLDARRVEYALINGKFPYGKTLLDCERIANEARATLFNHVVDMISFMGGAGNYDVLFMTGGGSNLILNDLRERYNYVEVLTADKEGHSMVTANVRGAYATVRFVQEKGVSI